MAEDYREKMKQFKFDYDVNNNDLFIYLEGKKSKGSIELGNFILDFDEKGDLVAIQILNISEILKKFFNKIKNASQIKNIKTEKVNFRNMEGINEQFIGEPLIVGKENEILKSEIG